MNHINYSDLIQTSCGINLSLGDAVIHFFITVYKFYTVHAEAVLTGELHNSSNIVSANTGYPIIIETNTVCGKPSAAACAL